MNAQLSSSLAFRPMMAEDLTWVAEVERQAYPYPWTAGNFRDSLNAGHLCMICERGGIPVGYAILMLAADEFHLLNITVSPAWQRQGLGAGVLDHVIDIARRASGRVLLLEVRPSNSSARRLYTRAGFVLIGVRRNYYPAATGREDALVMSLTL